jgi:acetoin utilization deacetylase AcuC-like enzyme
MPRLEEFKPEMIFISAGFDAHRDDDLGQLGWSSRLRLDHPAHQGRRATPRQGPHRVQLEGGYNLERAGRSVEAHLRVLADL